MRDLEIFSTCPPAGDLHPVAYLKQVRDVARWSEDHGCRGILVYSDNGQLDPWLVAHVIIQHTRTLCPLVAVQPVYMPPYSLAKTIATIGHLYGRRVYLNRVAGGFKNDLVALGDATPHDQRYERLAEYTQIVKLLLEGAAPVTFEGAHYQVDKLKLTPALRPELFPGIFVSGSSEAGLSAARAVGATAIKYPQPPSEETSSIGISSTGISSTGITSSGISSIDASTPTGIRVGIVARQNEADAWEVAHARFPADRRGQITRQLANKVSDSVWHKELSAINGHATKPYWLAPFENYKTMCPYLVGSYAQVAGELTRYFKAGSSAIILDIPPTSEELRHTIAAVAAAEREAH